MSNKELSPAKIMFGALGKERSEGFLSGMETTLDGVIAAFKLVSKGKKSLTVNEITSILNHNIDAYTKLLAEYTKEQDPDDSTTRPE